VSDINGKARKREEDEARRREQEKRDREEREKQRFDTAVPPVHLPRVRKVSCLLCIRVHDLTPSCFPSTRTRTNSKFIVFVSYIPVQHSILLTDVW
jgi:hypothetical protein